MTGPSFGEVVVVMLLTLPIVVGGLASLAPRAAGQERRQESAGQDRPPQAAAAGLNPGKPLHVWIAILIVWGVVLWGLVHV
jgi:hypothetical protein